MKNFSQICGKRKCPMISRVKKYSMENEWPGSPCLIRFENRQECGYGKSKKCEQDGKYEPDEKNIRPFRRYFGMVALAAVAVLSCVGADVVCAQTSSVDVRAASGQSVASGQGLESAGRRPGWRIVWEENFESERMDWSVWSKTVRGTADWADTQSADERCYGFRNGNLIRPNRGPGEAAGGYRSLAGYMAAALGSRCPLASGRRDRYHGAA